jgi:hypothetical protein
MACLQADLPWVTVALVAATAKSVGSLKAAANQAIKILEIRASHDGATSSNAPDVTDFGRCTFGVAGTASAQTPGKKDPGRAEAIQTTGNITYTVEPTTITAQESVNLAQYNGLYHYIIPFAAPLIVVGGQGFLVRQNSPNNVNSTGKIEYEE